MKTARKKFSPGERREIKERYIREYRIYREAYPGKPPSEVESVGDAFTALLFPVLKTRPDVRRAVTGDPNGVLSPLHFHNAYWWSARVLGAEVEVTLRPFRADRSLVTDSRNLKFMVRLCAVRKVGR